MDGAKIHCHPNITYYLRSLGITPIFLPAYCPFFNPIELFFGMVKRKMERHYDGSKKTDLVVAIAEVMNSFNGYSFKHNTKSVDTTKEVLMLGQHLV